MVLTTDLLLEFLVSGNAYSVQAADIAYRPSSSDSLIEISTGNIITGSFVNQINFANDGHLYTYLDGSEIAYTVHYEVVKNVSGTITDILLTQLIQITCGDWRTSSSHVYYSTNATS